MGGCFQNAAGALGVWDGGVEDLGYGADEAGSGEGAIDA